MIQLLIWNDKFPDNNISRGSIIKDFMGVLLHLYESFMKYSFDRFIYKNKSMPGSMIIDYITGCFNSYSSLISIYIWEKTK